MVKEIIANEAAVVISLSGSYLNTCGVSSDVDIQSAAVYFTADVSSNPHRCRSYLILFHYKLLIKTSLLKKYIAYAEEKFSSLTSVSNF